MMKMSAVGLIATSLVFAVIPAIADDLSGFLASGSCSPDQVEVLKNNVQGFSYVTQPAARLFESASSASRPTEMGLEAMERVSCHFLEDTTGRVLVRSEKKNACGWVDKSNLLHGGRQSEQTVVTEELDLGVCPPVPAMPIKVFCQRNSEEGQCNPDNKFILNSPIETKALLWNLPTEGGVSDDRGGKVNIYDFPGGRVIGQSDIFTVFRIFETRKTANGDTFLLIGSSESNVLGWVSRVDTEIWFSRLAVFYQRDSKGRIYKGISDMVSENRAGVIGLPPPELNDMLDSDVPFPKYPVLADRRNSGGSAAPNLNIGYIGSVCERCNMLSNAKEEATLSQKLENIRKADVVFLIDATESMKPYFQEVAEAVSSAMKTERDINGDLFLGNPNVQVGVYTYGDFLNKGRMGEGDDLQFEELVAVQPFFEGNELDGIAEGATFDDQVGLYQEAGEAALNRLVQLEAMSSDNPKYIVHIADHGWRGNVSAETIRTMQQKKILYLPIAVSGAYIEKENRRFVDQAQSVLDKLKTSSGLTMGLPEVLVSYGEGGEGGSSIARIRESINAALKTAEAVKGRVTDVLTDASTPPEQATVSGELPPGFSVMTEAVAELYGLTAEEIGKLKGRDIAIPGVIRVEDDPGKQDLGIEDRKKDTNWAYYVALESRLVPDLQGQMDKLCRSIGDANALRDLDAVVREIIEILTGDVLESREELSKYLSSKESIPLVSSTILGPRLRWIAGVLVSPDADQKSIELAKQKVCRSSLLLELVRGNKRLISPEKAKRGADPDQNMFWDGNRYNYKNTKAYRWLYEPPLGAAFIYVPLDYLP
jgi:hypothetical protein